MTVKNFWASEPEQLLAPFLKKKTLFAFDYDGTLAPIIDDPMAAGMAKSTRQLLAALAAKVPVAIVTGRARDDVWKFLDPGLAYVVGNHGIEGLKSEELFAVAARHAATAWAASLKASTAAMAGVAIEVKSYSLSVHFRSVPTEIREKVAAELYALCEALHPRPRLVRGKDVLNVVLPGAPNKGTALLEIMAEAAFEAAVFVGDDVTDEDVFLLKKPNILTICIGRGDVTAASYGVERQDEIDSLLRLCLGEKLG